MSTKKNAPDPAPDIMFNTPTESEGSSSSPASQREGGPPSPHSPQPQAPPPSDPFLNLPMDVLAPKRLTPEEFPVGKLEKLEDMINRSRWVVPVLPEGELEALLLAAIDLAEQAFCWMSAGPKFVPGLLHAHDGVAQKDYFPRLPEMPTEADEEDEAVKIVQLVKSNEPMGATIKAEEGTGKILIARIMHGGAADRSGLIHVGDEVSEVNGIPTAGKTPNDVLKILQNSVGTITFKLIPSEGRYLLRESKIRVRALFSYSTKEDKHIPCKEAGLDFKRSDILHIVCTGCLIRPDIRRRIGHFADIRIRPEQRVDPAGAPDH
ncbi:unnamed protein product [Cyprideis torosa]|uniref:Uncharacterized protein n=1 Tax=Cyprideis torosa TaxID=163714 RepID=A0A7R8WA59_9CRUS|nr:unnamed protein product [Cyprideis torosa]CAG0890587.1 unnamed protein product [Cyprideis torosa]